ncbi:MAG: hypothetical protein ACYCYR_09630 [Desulfobulbaceae bacterium]
MAEGSNPRVAIELWVDDQGTMHVREFKDQFNANLDQVEQKSQSVTDRIKSGWGSVKAAWVEITAGILAMREAWNLMNMSAKADQERAAFENLAASYGRGADEIIAALQRASGETIATMDLIRASGTAMMMGIDPDTVVELMEVARATAKMTGQDVSKAFGDISLAVGRQSRMILDNLGIIVDVEKANEDYAKSLGKTAADLSDAERKQAFLNATLQGGQDLMAKLGDQADTNADRLQRWAATVEDLKVQIGDGLNRAMMGLVGVLYTVEAGLMTLVQGAAKAGEGIGWITDKLRITSGAAQMWKLNADAASEAGVDFAGKATKMFEDMTASSGKATEASAAQLEAIRKQNQATEQLAAAEKKLTDQRGKLIEDAKKQAQEQQQATDEMYREAGLGADQYFRQEADALVKKASKWQAAGADTLQTEEWLYNELARLSEEAWGKGEEMAGVYLDNMQAQTTTLVESFNVAQQTMSEKLTEISGQAEQLDGTEIGLVATFDGSAVMQGLDQLVARFNALRAAAEGAPAAQQPATPSAPADSGAGATQTRTVTNSTVINVNQQISRGDIIAIAAEARRREARA